MTDKDVLQLSRMHEEVRQRIRSQPRSDKKTTMRQMAQTRFREAYSEADLELESNPDPQMPEDRP